MKPEMMQDERNKPLGATGSTISNNANSGNSAEGLEFTPQQVLVDAP